MLEPRDYHPRMGETAQGGLDWGRYLQVARRWKWLLLAIIVVIPTAVYLVSKSVPKTYESSTTLQVEGTTLSSSQLAGVVSFSIDGVAEAARLIQTTPVARLVAKNIGESPDQAGSLLGAVAVHFDETEQSGFMTITARDQDPERAARIAAGFAAAIGATRTSDSLRKIDTAITQIENTPARTPEAQAQRYDQLKQLQALRAGQSDTTHIIEPAGVPGTPISPNPRRNTMLALVFALFVAGGLVALLDRTDRRLHKPEELAQAVGAPLLAMVPGDAFPRGSRGPQVREAFQTLRTGLTYFNVDRDLKSVMITSPFRADGKTTVATDLSIAMAQGGHDVVLIDADMRRPQVAKRLGVADQVHFGLDAVLVEHRPVDDALMELGIDGGRLRILPGGPPPPNPSVLLASRRMESLLRGLAELVDFVIIDTPALLTVSDAIPLIEQVSGTVLVGRVEHSTEDSLQKVREVISTARGEILGVVATGTRGGGLYDYRYGYYGEDGSDNGDVATADTNGDRPWQVTPGKPAPESRPSSTSTS
jgi:capsular exopolysaccharide synthesis family protein